MTRSLRSLVVLFVATAATAAAPGVGAQPAVTGNRLDSDHLIFIIDTSGSMRRYEWDRVQAQVQETLAAHPAVEAFQVLNDEAQPLLETFRGAWMPNTPEFRDRVLEALSDWDAFSNSSPQRAILAAISDYYDPEKSISLYVMGDDFPATGFPTIEFLVEQVAALNQDGGGYRMRIHAVAFPVYWDALGQMGTSARYAMLMQQIARQNGGSFVALPSRNANGGVTREPMTGLAAAGRRTLVLVDTSARMAGEPWARAVASIERLAADIGPGEEIQVLGFDAEARPLVGDADGGWLSLGEAEREQLALALQGTVPAGESSLDAAVRAVNENEVTADRVFLLVAELPTIGADDAALPGSDSVPEAVRIFNRSMRDVSRAKPINVLLFGDEQLSVPAYWSMALATGGSLVSPAGDWP